MSKNTTGSFFARLRQRWFDRRLNREIFDRIMPHLERERNAGYSFSTGEEMDAQTEDLDIQPLLDAVEERIRNMPTAYGACFRHIMHRELHARLRRYELAARRRVRRTCDPRHVAVHV